MVRLARVVIPDHPHHVPQQVAQIERHGTDFMSVPSIAQSGSKPARLEYRTGLPLIPDCAIDAPAKP
jgi:hypothetical protein